MGRAGEGSAAGVPGLGQGAGVLQREAGSLQQRRRQRGRRAARGVPEGSGLSPASRRRRPATSAGTAGAAGPRGRPRRCRGPGRWRAGPGRTGGGTTASRRRVGRGRRRREALAAPLRLGSGVGDLLAARAFINPSPDVRRGRPPRPTPPGEGPGTGGNGTGDAPLCPAPAEPPRLPPELASSPRPQITALPELPILPVRSLLPGHKPTAAAMGVPALTPAGGEAPRAALPKPLALEPPRRVSNGSRMRGAQRVPLRRIASGSCRGWGSEVPLGVLLPSPSLWVSPAPLRSQIPSPGQRRGQREPPGTAGRLLPWFCRSGKRWQTRAWLGACWPLAEPAGTLGSISGMELPWKASVPQGWPVSPTPPASPWELAGAHNEKRCSKPMKDEPPQLSPSWLEQSKMCWKGPLLSKKGYQNLSYLNFQLRKVKDLRGQVFNYCKKVSRNLQNDILFHDELMCIPRPTFNPGAAGCIC